MADITGPISTLAGALYGVPDGAKCDNHPKRKATHRLQGETDSFGCEMHDLCEQCYQRYRKEDREADRSGVCDWCKEAATDLRDRRDYDEGLYGPVYRVCGGCVRRQNEELEEENGFDDYDDPGDWDDEDTDQYPPPARIAGARPKPSVTCKSCGKPWAPKHQCRART